MLGCNRLPVKGRYGAAILRYSRLAAPFARTAAMQSTQGASQRFIATCYPTEQVSLAEAASDVMYDQSPFFTAC
jgi:hypothetical protein